MGDEKAKKPDLPKGAPKDLTDFVECTAATLTFKPGKLGWLGKIDLEVATIEPEISFTAGENGAIDIRIGAGFVGVTVTGTITGGQLSIDPGVLPAKIADPLQAWVKDLNGWMKSKGKQFGKATLDKGGALSLTKAALAVAPADDKKVKAPVGPDRKLVAGGVLGLFGLVAIVLVVNAVGLPKSASVPPAASGSLPPTTAPSTAASAPAATLGTVSPSQTVNAFALSPLCSGPVVEIVDHFYPDLVQGGDGTPAPFDTAGKRYCLTHLATYHWNNGAGAPEGGTLSIKDATGATVGGGPWKAIGTPGTGGTLSGWEAGWAGAQQPDIRLDPPVILEGSYTLYDSDPSTWSWSNQSGGVGFIRVWGVAYTGP